MIRKKAVAIFGCGPAGLFAAQAARSLGHAVDIFSVKKFSDMFGAQYLHEPIPGLSGEAFDVMYSLWGTNLGYARKVYGPELGPEMVDSVSPSKLLGIRPAWNIRTAYARAWERFESRITDTMITPENLHNLMILKHRYSLVVNSMPARALCARRGHQFHSAEIWAIGDAPEANVYCPVHVSMDSVVCNGEPSPGWYRASNILGWHTAEWPGRLRPPIEGVVKVHKPISTDCDCLSAINGVRVLRVGRYGTWTKGVLSHDAYGETWKALR